MVGEAVAGTRIRKQARPTGVMLALHANGTKLVLIEKLDRLTRDLMIQESIVAACNVINSS